MCREFQQNWRASSLSGGTFWNDEQRVDDISAVTGNRNQFLWRQMCQAFSQHSSASAVERAIYGVLGGQIAPVLSHARTWEDCMWSYFKFMTTKIIQQTLAEQVKNQPDLEYSSSDAKQTSLTAQEIAKQFVQHNELLPVQARNAALDIYHKLQWSLILDNPSAIETSLVEHIASAFSSLTSSVQASPFSPASNAITLYQERNEQKHSLGNER